MKRLYKTILYIESVITKKPKMQTVLFTRATKNEGLVIDQGNQYGHTTANKYQNPTSACLANLIRLTRSKKVENLC